MNEVIKNPFERMQKSAVVILCILFCPFVCVVNAQTETKVIWDYPIKPGMKEWHQLKTLEEMYQAYQIPDSVLKQLDTESLVDICLNYPAPPLFLFFDTPQQGFSGYYSRFNGIQELFDRKEAGKYLLKRYAMMSFSEFNPLWQLHEQGRFAVYYTYIESILAQPQVVASLDAQGRKQLLQEAIRKIDEKLSKIDLFGGHGIEINLWVIGRLLYSENKLTSQDYNLQNIQTAIATGKFTDIDVDLLYQQAKEYAYENE